MAERRMFAKTIIDSDAFLDMPTSSQLLYFHLCMRADDEGFINKPKAIMRLISATEDDLKLLIIKKFVIPFESGVVVIKHWKIHNRISKDRCVETKYKDEKNILELDENKAYKLSKNIFLQNEQIKIVQNTQNCTEKSVQKTENAQTESVQKTENAQIAQNCTSALEIGRDKVCEIEAEPPHTKCMQNVCKMYTQVRLGKVRLGKNKTYAQNAQNAQNKKTLEELFEKFWEAYPRKVNKKRAKELFDRKVGLNSDLFDTVMQALEKHKSGKQWLEDNGQFIPYPTTWLNGERWNDEVVVFDNRNPKQSQGMKEILALACAGEDDEESGL